MIRLIFNPRSNLYLVYTRYWYVNGKTFNSFLDFLDYSGNEPWVESSFDQGMTIKGVKKMLNEKLISEKCGLWNG